MDEPILRPPSFSWTQLEQISFPELRFQGLSRVADKMIFGGGGGEGPRCADKMPPLRLSLAGRRGHLTNLTRRGGGEGIPRQALEQL